MSATPEHAATEAHSAAERVAKYGEAIWNASRADEGSISYIGANHVARAVIAVADEEQAALRRGGKTLGEVLDRSLRDVLDASGMHHIIDETGDGDWALVWEHLAELRPRLEAAEAKIVRVRAELDEWEASYGVDPLPDHWGITARIASLRAALGGTR